MNNLLTPDPKPNPQRAELLLESNRTKIISSLNSLIDACEDVIDPFFYQFIKRHIAHFLLSSDLNPMLFRISESINQAIKNNEITMINDCLQILVTIYSEESSRNNIRYLAADRKYSSGAVMDLINEIGDDTFSFVPIPFSDNRFYNGIITIEKCFASIQKCTPELHREIMVLVQRICLYQISPLTSGETMHSGSKLDYLGCIFLNSNMDEHSWYFWADKIVHEAAHQVLLSIMLEDEVVLNPDCERYKSPLRTEARTVTGIYHAAFVIYRIIYFFDAMLDKENLTDRECLEVRNSLLDYIIKFRDAYQIIQIYGKLTPYGKRLIETCELSVCEIEKKYD